jgi:hypothetical protein
MTPINQTDLFVVAIEKHLITLARYGELGQPISTVQA